MVGMTGITFLPPMSADLADGTPFGAKPVGAPHFRPSRPIPGVGRCLA